MSCSSIATSYAPSLSRLPMSSHGREVEGPVLKLPFFLGHLTRTIAFHDLPHQTKTHLASTLDEERGFICLVLSPEICGKNTRYKPNSPNPRQLDDLTNAPPLSEIACLLLWRRNTKFETGERSTRTESWAPCTLSTYTRSRARLQINNLQLGGWLVLAVQDLDKGDRWKQLSQVKICAVAGTKSKGHKIGSVLSLSYEASS